MAGKKRSLRGGGNILDLLSGRKKTAGSTSAAPLEVDGDPYDFIDTQSLRQDTRRAKRLHIDDDNTRVPAKKEVPTTPVYVEKRSLHVTPSSSRAKANKRSPLFLSEEERLHQREEEEIKKALEASLQEKEREDRKRRRETIREESEQSKILHQLQQKKDNLRETIETVIRARDLCKQDMQIERDILRATEHKEEATPEDTKSTQPLPSTKSDTKQVRLLMKKVSIRSLKSKKRSDEYKTVITSIVARDAKSIAQDENIVESDDATPPLSREASIEPPPISTAAQSVDSIREQLPVATNTDNSHAEYDSKLSDEANLDLATAGVLTRSSNLEPNTQSSGSRSIPFQVVSHPSPPTEPNEHMDTSGRGITRTPPPTEPNKHMDTSGRGITRTPPPTEPNKHMDTSGRGITRTPPPTEPNEHMDTSGRGITRTPPPTEPNEHMDTSGRGITRTPPPTEPNKHMDTSGRGITRTPPPTEPNKHMDTSGRGRTRSSCLSLSRKKRKRSSPQKILFQEMDNSSPMKLPQVKRIKSVEEVSKVVLSKEEEVTTVKYAAINEHLPAATPEDVKEITRDVDETSDSNVNQGNCSKSLALSTQDTRDVKEITRDVDNTSDSNVNQGNCSKSLALSTQDTRSPPLHVSSRPSMDVHALNLRLPKMYCPSGSSPTEHTPKIIERFNSYFSQLREAQSKVLTRLKWGEPVKMGSSQQLVFGVTTGRTTRRSKMTHRFNLILPKRTRTKTAVESSNKNKTFSLEESTPEEKDEMLTQQSTASQLSAENSPMNYDYDQAYDALESDAMETDAVRSPDKSNSMNGSQPVSPTGEDVCDDLIMLNTQGEVTTPHISHISHTSHTSPAASGASHTSLSTLKRSTRSQRQLPETVSQKTPSSNQKGNSALDFDKEATPPLNWLNSRSQKVGNSKPTSNRKRTPSLTMKRQKIRKPPKSAAAKMILEVTPQSESEEESVVLERTLTPPQEDLSDVPERTLTPPQKDLSDVPERTDLSDVESDGVRRRRNSLRNKWLPLSSESEGEATVMAEERRGTGVIDLTEDTQGTSPPPTTTHTRYTRSSKQQLSTCPLCSKQFLPSVIAVHAAQCDGLDNTSSPPSSFRTKQTASRATRRSYQPTLHQLQAKEKEVLTKTGDRIDSDSDVSTYGPPDENDNPLLDKLSSALDGSIESDDNHVTTSSKELRVIPTEDGGFMVDESTISNSPIRSFTKISDMTAKDRERYRNQFNRPPPKSRGGRAAVATGGTWSSDFGELAGSSKGGRGRGRGGAGKRRWKSRGKGNRFSKRRPRN